MSQAYRKKPVVVEATQLTEGNCHEVAVWCGGALCWRVEDYAGIKFAGNRISVSRLPSGQVKADLIGISIQTLEGPLLAGLGDWVIKGMVGEFYPCKPDIFAQTYDLVADSVWTQEEIDVHLDAILKASGSALANYSLPGTLERMRAAVTTALHTTYLQGRNRSHGRGKGGRPVG